MRPIETNTGIYTDIIERLANLDRDRYRNVHRDTKRDMHSQIETDPGIHTDAVYCIRQNCRLRQRQVLKYIQRIQKNLQTQIETDA
jgi:hypothetical protein